MSVRGKARLRKFGNRNTWDRWPWRFSSIGCTFCLSVSTVVQTPSFPIEHKTPHPPASESLCRLPLVYLMESLGSIGGNLLTLGFFFYAKSQFGWSEKSNLIMATAEGLVYTLGALLASPLSSILGRRWLLRLIHAAMAVLAAVALFLTSDMAVAALLVLYVLIEAMQWPALESLVSAGATRKQLSGRIMAYNLIWSGGGVLAVAISGTLIALRPSSIFLLTLFGHVVCLAVSFLPARLTRWPQARADDAMAPPDERSVALGQTAMCLCAHRPAGDVRGRVLNRRIMPALPVITHFAPATQTLIASVWTATAGWRSSWPAPSPGGTPGPASCWPQPWRCCCRSCSCRSGFSRSCICRWALT